MPILRCPSASANLTGLPPAYALRSRVLGSRLSPRSDHGSTYWSVSGRVSVKAHGRVGFSASSSARVSRWIQFGVTRLCRSARSRVAASIGGILWIQPGSSSMGGASGTVCRYPARERSTRAGIAATGCARCRDVSTFPLIDREACVAVGSRQAVASPVSPNFHRGARVDLESRDECDAAPASGACIGGVTGDASSRRTAGIAHLPRPLPVTIPSR